MNSKIVVPTAAFKRLKAASHDARNERWLTYGEALAEIEKEFSVASEAAMIILYGLVATSNVRCLNERGELVEEDECTIAEFGRLQLWSVPADDLRHWLSEWSPKSIEDAITQLLRKGEKPGKRFYDHVRDYCGGWEMEGERRKIKRGYGDKTIERALKSLKDR
jgi:hypothetical protein